jgi:hypothetical protein
VKHTPEIVKLLLPHRQSRGISQQISQQSNQKNQRHSQHFCHQFWSTIQLMLFLRHEIVRAKHGCPLDLFLYGVRPLAAGLHIFGYLMDQHLWPAAIS